MSSQVAQQRPARRGDLPSVEHRGTERTTIATLRITPTFPPQCSYSRRGKERGKSLNTSSCVTRKTLPSQRWSCWKYDETPFTGRLLPSSAWGGSSGWGGLSLRGSLSLWLSWSSCGSSLGSRLSGHGSTVFFCPGCRRLQLGLRSLQLL